MILGTLPNTPQGSADDLIREIFNMTRAEYDANMIQNAHWPQLSLQARERYGFSLESWCILRGYTQGLEKIVYVAVKGQVNGNEFLKFLGRLPEALPSGFERLGFGEALGQDYATKVERYADVAFQNLIKAVPQLESVLPSVLRDWAMRRYGTNRERQPSSS